MDASNSLSAARLPVAVFCAQTTEGETLARSVALRPLLNGEFEARTPQQIEAALAKAKAILSASPQLDSPNASSFYMPSAGRRALFIACPGRLSKTDLLAAFNCLPSELLPGPVVSIGPGDAAMAARRAAIGGSFARAPGVAEHWAKVDEEGVAAALARAQDMVAQADQAAIKARERAAAEKAERELAERIKAKRRFSASFGSEAKAPLLVINFHSSYRREGVRSRLAFEDHNAVIVPLLDLLQGSWSERLPRSDVSAKGLSEKTQEVMRSILQNNRNDQNPSQNQAMARMIGDARSFIDSLSTEFANGRWIVVGHTKSGVFQESEIDNGAVCHTAVEALRPFCEVDPVALNTTEKGMDARDIDFIERVAAGQDFSSAQIDSQWRIDQISHSNADRQAEMAQAILTQGAPLLALISRIDLKLASPSLNASSDRPGL